MQIIYSGFDTISFAVKGAAQPSMLMQLQIYKQRAADNQADEAISVAEGALKGLIAPTGMKGGYAYVLKLGGDLGHVISIKKTLSKHLWNVHVKIRALTLACYGWEQALANVFSDLKTLGVSNHEISLNRVDYAIDFLNADFVLDPTHFVAHSHVKKAAHKLEINAYSRGQACESVTLGKMPNRQVIVYDKRREAIEKRKPVWFEIWNIDPKNISQTVHRVEIRLGKNELLKSKIRTLEDLKDRVNSAMVHAVQVIRYVTPRKSDQNISRWPNHKLWDAVQLHVKDHLLKNLNYVEPSRIKQVIKSQKALESKKQILGNMANLSVFEEMVPDRVKEDMVKFIMDEFSIIEANDDHPFWKSRIKTQDRFSFL